MNKPLFFPAFVSDKRNGGVKRSDQIRDIVSDHVDQILPFKLLSNPSIPKLFYSFAFFTFPLVNSLSLKDRLRQAFFLASISVLINKLESPKKAIVEFSTSLNMFLPLFFKKVGIEYILLTHNIEFLVPSQYDLKTYSSIYSVERQAIEGANACFCISDFDVQVCSVFNKRTYCLPYFPVGKDRRIFHDISEARKESNKTYYLVLGTVSNHPTMQGMISLLNYIHKNVSNQSIVVAGFGTEYLPEPLKASFDIKGEVTQDELYDLLVHTKAVLIEQPSTSGFLTRLVELNLASVPVFLRGNYAQANDLEEYGIYKWTCFFDITAKANFMRQKKFKCPDSEVANLVNEIIQL